MQQLHIIQPATPAKLSDSNQRYTPRQYVELVERVLGGIDLDPTADPTKRVPARWHITEAMDCLTTPWDTVGNEPPKTIFMNPPYSNAHPYIARLCEYLAANPEAMAITLTHQGLMQTRGSGSAFAVMAKAFCFPTRRINFDYPDHLDAKRGNDRDSLFAYWGNGERLSHFVELFKPLGIVLKPAMEEVK